MDDDTQAKCGAIAQWEFGPDVSMADKYPDCEYATSLVATMRAARRLRELPEPLILEVTSTGHARIYSIANGRLNNAVKIPDNPQLAAFECIYEFVAAQRKEKP